ncbi:MAG: IgGFc-binding protein [Ignavibacteria bacterium]|nr:IgGFc-binding protein [Ignavibacteria bacterium]
MLLLLVVCVSFYNLSAQSGVVNIREKTTEGTEFWLCFQRNFKDTPPNQAPTKSSNDLFLELFITGSNDSKVSIEIDGLGFRREIKVAGGTVVNVKIDPAAQVKGEEIAQRLAIHIVSDNPISVYGLNSRFQTTDTYLGLPVSVLGTEYRAIGYNYSEGLLSQFAIIATEDETNVTITPSSYTSKGHPPGVPYTVKLRRGDVFQVTSNLDMNAKTDLTGSKITSDKKIALFSGHQCAYVPERVVGCNHLVEQMPPVNAWGNHYYVGMLEGRSKYTIRVLANEPNTKVFENSVLVATLGAGEFYENSSVRQHLQITGDHPILVVQYSQGFLNGDAISDPMMLLASPTQQFIKAYRFATPKSGEWRHFVNVVVPTEAIASLRLDGRMVDSTIFETLGLSRYSIAQIQVLYGTHTLRAEQPFGMYSYGFGYGSQAYDAYGTMGGQSFFEIEPVPDTIAPSGESRLLSGRIQTIIRDDRTTDRGLKSVKVLFAQGLQTAIPTIEEGLPQVTFLVKPIQSNTPGRMVLQATDVAGNRSIFTVCYSLDNQTEKYAFDFCQGENKECLPEKSWQAGVYGILGQSYLSPDFSSTGTVISNGKFSNGSGTGGYGGMFISKRLEADFALSTRVELHNTAGVIVAPDSTVGQIRDPNTGAIVPFQESRSIKLTGLSMSLGIAVEWYVDRSIYFLAGMQGEMLLSKSVEVKRSILLPINAVFQSNGESEIIEPVTELSSLQTIRLGAFGGIGFTQSIGNSISVFTEATYTQLFGSIISDGKWNVSRLHLHVGAKLRW